MERDTDNTDFAGDALASPREIAAVETQCAEFAVTTTCANEMDTLGTDTCVGRLTAFLESSVLFFIRMMGLNKSNRFMHTSSYGSARA